MNVGASADSLISDSSMTLYLVQRVHWLRAQAQKNRWEEELLLIKYEMEWTTRYFLHRARQWQDKFQITDIDAGPKAYAAR